MKLLTILFLGFCISFADALFPYTAIALGAWTLGAVTLMNWEKLFSK
jgi:hypothetical protein